MPTLIHVNGPINSGKSSVGRALARLLPDARFIDGDDHGAPEGAPLPARIAAALRRIEACIAQTDAACLVVAYPLDQANYERLKAASEQRGMRFLVLTLAPPLTVALTDRGGRTLSPAERQRIAEMYREGYHRRPFSDVVVDTSGLTPQESAERAMAEFGRASLLAWRPVGDR
jgi:hypothetical protein